MINHLQEETTPILLCFTKGKKALRSLHDSGPDLDPIIRGESGIAWPKAGAYLGRGQSGKPSRAPLPNDVQTLKFKKPGPFMDFDAGKKSS